MPIDASWSVAAFLLPHQDDEFGVFGLIEGCGARSMQAVCIYLTDGEANAAIGPRRNAESQAVLLRLEVRPENIHFLGSDLQIRDGMLHNHLDQTYQAL